MKKNFVFAIAYTGVSLLVEAMLIVATELRVPRDNAVIAPIVLTIPPVLTTWICGYRRPNEFVTLAVLTSILTLIVTLGIDRLTGKSTGLLQPILSRFISGFLAGTIANRSTGLRRNAR